MQEASQMDDPYLTEDSLFAFTPAYVVGFACAFIGGAVGCWLEYRKLPPGEKGLPKFGFLFFVSFLISALLVCGGFYTRGVSVILKGENRNWLGLLAIWTFAVNPAVCSLLSKRHSLNLIMNGFVGSAAGMVIGFFVRFAIRFMTGY